MPWRLVGLRAILGFCTLIVVALVVFVATNVLPGDAARVILGRSATPEALTALRTQLGLDRPLPIQFLTWLWDMGHFDLGTSFITKDDVLNLLAPRIANTSLLLAVTAVITVPLSVAIGVLMAVCAGGRFDTVANAALIIMAGVPEFVFAILLILVFATQVFHILPPTTLLPAGQTILENPQVLVLPAGTLILAIIPYLARLVRGSMMEALASEYVVIARLKGVPERQIILRHALRNSLVPVIQASALSLAFILGGAVVVEFIFQYPGLGSALQKSVEQRDINVIQAIVMIFSAGYILFNLVADVLTILVTPRLRA